MILEVLYNVCVILFGVSAATTIIHNVSIRNRLERTGYSVDGSKVSLMEKILYFIQDYTFLLVPFYNFKKAVWQNVFKKNTLNYEEERKAKYKQRRMLFEKNETNVVTTKETDKNDAKSTSSSNLNTKTVTNIKDKNETKEKTFSSLEDEYNYYNAQYLKQKKEYLEVKDDTSVPYKIRYLMYMKASETLNYCKLLKSKIEEEKIYEKMSENERLLYRTRHLSSDNK